MDRFQGLIGILVIVGLAFLFSTQKSRVKWRIVCWGLGLQAIFGLFMLKTDMGQAIFDNVRIGANMCLDFTKEGSNFVFGALCPLPEPEEEPAAEIEDGDASTGSGIDEDAAKEAEAEGPEAEMPAAGGTEADADDDPIGFNLAFQCLTTIIFFSSLMAVLYHLGIMQLVVRVFAMIMRRTMGTSGAESLSAAGNIFVGQTESPILIRPYVKEMTRSELATVMTGGFATIAGSVFILYTSYGVDAGHLLTASVMSAPAALMISKVMFPETEESRTAGTIKVEMKRETLNIVDAAASGAAVGVKLAINVAAMLLAFVALLAMINWFLGLAGEGIDHLFSCDLYTDENPLSMAMIFGWIFSPLAWCLGVCPDDTIRVGELIGTKISVNELVAYGELKEMIAPDNVHRITEKSKVIATYALCGFANFSSIAIQIGGIGGLAPERRRDLARLGLKTMIGGAFASFTTAALAGVLI